MSWNLDLAADRQSRMKLPQYNLYELLIAVVFLGLFAAVAAETAWNPYYFIHGIVMAAVLLLPIYLLVILMIRQHRSR